VECGREVREQRRKGCIHDVLDREGVRMEEDVGGFDVGVDYALGVQP
jgi:hypothetical protein